MDDLFLSYLQAGFFGSIIIIVVLILRLCLCKAPRQLICILWLLAAVRLLIPFVPESSLSLQPELPAYLSPSQQVEQISPDADVDDMPALPDAPPVSETPEIPNVPSVPVTPNVPNVPVTPDIPQEENIRWTEAAFVVWIVGAAVMMLFAVISYLRLQHSVRLAVQTQPGVYASNRITGAFVMGYWRPRVYLPADLPEEDCAHILAHEQAHIARGDHWWKLLGFICLCMHWYNPLVWVCYVLFCRDTEVACDERVVWHMELAQRKAYSQALLNCGKRFSGLTAVTLCFGKLSLGQRIKNVLSYRKPGFWITAIAGMLAVMVAICFLTVPEPEQREIDEPAATETPTQEPTQAPTQAPTEAPTQAPTQAPTEPEPPKPTVDADGIIASGEWDASNRTWILTKDGVFTVSGVGHLQEALYYEWMPHADLITKIVINEGITEIPNNVFKELPNLRSVQLPESLVKIGRYAFMNCENLETINIPSGLTIIEMGTFYGCTNLKKMNFSENTSVQTIEAEAFGNMGLTEFVAPASLKKLEGRALVANSALHTVVLRGDNAYIQDYAFEGCSNLKKVVIEETVNGVGPILFRDCPAIEHLEVYAAAGMNNFGNRPALKTVIWGGQRQTLVSFENCRGLTSITVTAPIKEIGMNTFHNCTSLKEFTIPETVTKINLMAFANTGITKLVIPATVTELDSQVFLGEQDSKYDSKKQAALKEIVFMGDCPQMKMPEKQHLPSQSTFWGVTAIAYYPANNPTWTADKLQDYGGNITWIAVE